MALLASIASGNFTAAATWGLVDATSYNGLQTTGNAFGTSYSATNRTTGFTPGAITVSHIGFKLANRTGTTGTLSLHIALNSTHVEVAGTEVTINVADLPAATASALNGGWHFLKLAAPVTLAAATAYEVEGKTSSANQVTPFSSASGPNFSIALVTTTTQTPVAGDDMIIAGEYTGAGTSNSFTITMNETATTDYGSTPTATNALLTPGIALCNKGTLTWGTTAATNYNLKLSNSFIVYAGGVHNQGSVGAECPRNSTMVLQFDPGTNVDYGYVVRNLGTDVGQGLSRTSGKNIFHCYLNTDEAIASTSLGVDTDTGWLDNDEIAVASTTRTNTDCEAGTLNGNAGASSLTVDGFLGAGGGLAVAHSGTSPTQAEVILLTRNVVIRGASATLQAYVQFDATAEVDRDWTEFRWLGSNTGTKRGIYVVTSTGNCNIQYCSLRDFIVTGSTGLILTANNFVFSNNVIWNTASNFVNFSSASSGTAITITNNVFIKNITANQTGVQLSDVGLDFSNNAIVGATGPGVAIAENNALIGTHDSNTIHSGAGAGIIIQGSAFGIMSNYTVWRCNSYGMTIQAGEITMTDYVAFGNSSANINPGYGGKLILINPILNGDSSFATSYGFYIGTNMGGELIVINGDLSTASGIKVAHGSADIYAGLSPGFLKMSLINTKLGAATEIIGQTALLPSSMIGSQDHDQVAGAHRTYRRYGTIYIETTTTQAGGHSIKMTPNNASFKLESSGWYGGFKVQVANGQTCSPTVYVYEDASYNGARARLIVKQNNLLGITTDTVLDTATAASDGAWEALTGTTAAVTNDGTLEFVVDCDGTAGNLFVDTFSAVVT